MASSSMRSQVKLLEGSNFCMSLRDYLAYILSLDRGQRVNAAWQRGQLHLPSGSVVAS